MNKAVVVASEADGDLHNMEARRRRRPWLEEGGILRLKKEANAARHLWAEDKFIPGALDRWLEFERKQGANKPEEEAPAGVVAAGKNKKVVRSRLPRDLIGYMAADPYTVLPDISDEKLATRTPAFLQLYAIAKIFEAKTRAYHNALIAQYNERGYAEDEREVTDDEFES